MLDFTLEQEEFLLVTLQKVHEDFIEIKDSLDVIDNKLKIYLERHNKMMALMESWFLPSPPYNK